MNWQIEEILLVKFAGHNKTKFKNHVLLIRKQMMNSSTIIISLFSHIEHKVFLFCIHSFSGEQI